MRHSVKDSIEVLQQIKEIVDSLLMVDAALKGKYRMTFTVKRRLEDIESIAARAIERLSGHSNKQADKIGANNGESTSKNQSVD